MCVYTTSDGRSTGKLEVTSMLRGSLFFFLPRVGDLKVPCHPFYPLELLYIFRVVPLKCLGVPRSLFRDLGARTNFQALSRFVQKLQVLSRGMG